MCAATCARRWIRSAQDEQMLTHLRAAEVLAEGLADQRRLGIVYRMLANALRQMQDYEPALAYSQRTHAIATALGDVRLQLEGNLAMGWTLLIAWVITVRPWSTCSRP